MMGVAANVIEPHDSNVSSDRMLVSDIGKTLSDSLGKPVSMKVQVAVRIKPNWIESDSKNLQRKPSRTDILDVSKHDNEIRILGEHGQVGGVPRVFKYDYIFDVDSTQHQIYDNAVSALTDRFFEGYNVTVMAYGQTSSGKSYTMGTSGESHTKGVIDFALEQIFEQSQNVAAGQDNIKREFAISFIEIYNEELIDLISDSSNVYNRSTIQIREDNRGRIIWSGATEKKIHSVEDALALLENGSSIRQTGSTKMNSQSSRSHAIYSIIQTQTQVKSGVEMRSVSKFNFVDLAGSERLKKTQAVGDRAKEGISINSGLLALGNVISALSIVQDRSKANPSIFIPYRVSKLTRLLQDSLGGTAYTIMIACVSMSRSDVMETLDTLRYASKASSISNKGTDNWESIDASLQSQVMSLKQDIARLEEELRKRESIANAQGTTSINSETLKKNILLQHQLDKHVQSLQLELETSNEAYSDLLLKFNELCEEIENNNLYPSQSSKSPQHKNTPNSFSIKYDDLSPESKQAYSKNSNGSPDNRFQFELGDLAFSSELQSKNNFTGTNDSSSTTSKLAPGIFDSRLNVNLSNNKALAVINSIGSDKRFSRVPGTRSKLKDPLKITQSGIDFEYKPGTDFNLDSQRDSNSGLNLGLELHSSNNSLYSLSENGETSDNYSSADFYPVKKLDDLSSLKHNSNSVIEADYEQMVKEFEIELSELRDELLSKNTQLEINYTKLEFAEQMNKSLSSKLEAIENRLHQSEQDANADKANLNKLQVKLILLEDNITNLQRVNLAQKQSIDGYETMRLSRVSKSTTTQDEIDNEIESIKNAHVKDIEDLSAMGRLQLDLAKQEHDKAMYQLETKFKNYISDLDSQHIAEIAELEEKHLAIAAEVRELQPVIVKESKSIQTTLTLGEPISAQPYQPIDPNIKDPASNAHPQNFGNMNNSGDSKDMQSYKKRILLVLKFLQNQLFERTNSIKEFQRIAQQSISHSYSAEIRSLSLYSSRSTDDMAVIDYNKHKRRVDNINQMSIGERKHMFTRESHSYYVPNNSDDSSVCALLQKNSLSIANTNTSHFSSPNARQLHNDRKFVNPSKISPRHPSRLSAPYSRSNSKSLFSSKSVYANDPIQQMLLSPLGIYTNEEFDDISGTQRKKFNSIDPLHSACLSINAFIDSEIPLINAENIFSPNAIYGTEYICYRAIQDSPTLVSNLTFGDTTNSLDKLTSLLKGSIESARVVRAKATDLRARSINHSDLPTFSPITESNHADLDLIFGTYNDLLDEVDRANINKQNLVFMNEHLSRALEALEAQTATLMAYCSSLPLAHHTESLNHHKNAQSKQIFDSNSEKFATNNIYDPKTSNNIASFTKTVSDGTPKVPKKKENQKKSKMSLYNITDNDSSTEMINQNLKILEMSDKRGGQLSPTVPVELYKTILEERNSLVQKISSYQILINEQHSRLRRQEKAIASISGSPSISSFKSTSANSFKNRNNNRRIVSIGSVHHLKSKLSFDSSPRGLFDSQANVPSGKNADKKLYPFEGKGSFGFSKLAHMTRSNSADFCISSPRKFTNAFELKPSQGAGLRLKSTISPVSPHNWTLNSKRDISNASSNNDRILISPSPRNLDQNLHQLSTHNLDDNPTKAPRSEMRYLALVPKQTDDGKKTIEKTQAEDDNQAIRSPAIRNASMLLSFENSSDFDKNSLVFSGLDVNSLLDSENLCIDENPPSDLSFKNADLSTDIGNVNNHLLNSNLERTSLVGTPGGLVYNTLKTKEEIDPVDSRELNISEFTSVNQLAGISDNNNDNSSAQNRNIDTKITKQDLRQQRHQSLGEDTSNKRYISNILNGSYSFGENYSDPGTNLQRIDAELLELQAQLQDAVEQLQESEMSVEKQNEVIEKLESELNTHKLLINALEANLTNCELQISEYKEDSVRYANELVRSKSECKTLNEQIKQLTYRLEESKTSVNQVAYDRDLLHKRNIALTNELEGTRQKKKSSFFCF